MRLRHPNTAFLIALVMLFASTTASAHHPMGGGTPETYIQGFLSGLGHPIIGIDHLAFIVGVGLVLGLGLTRGFVAPLALIGAAVAGTVLNWSGIAIPFIETIVALSVLGVAGTVFFKPRLETLLTVGGAAAAFCHGQAYAGAIIGAESTPLVAYLLGFTLIQITIASTAFVFTRWLVAQHIDGDSRALRAVSGAAIGSVGLVSLAIAIVM